MKRFAENVYQQIFAPEMGRMSQVRLHVRNDLHLFRKAWHMCMGLLIAFIYLSGISATTGVVILGTLFALSVTAEVLRLRVPSINEKVVRFWCPIMRSCEVNRVSGIPYYLLAALLAVGIFPKPVAVLSILYLAVGDPIASLVGILYGDRSIRFSNGKSLIGTLGGIAACFAVGFVFLKTLGLPNLDTFLIALIGGFAGGLAEHLPLETDDNFSIPVVSGFVLWLTFILFGI
jgi:dolichol kinase